MDKVLLWRKKLKHLEEEMRVEREAIEARERWEKNVILMKAQREKLDAQIQKAEELISSYKAREASSRKLEYYRQCCLERIASAVSNLPEQ